MNELDYVSYLEKKIKFGEGTYDIRWETFSPIFIRQCENARLIVDCGAEFGFYIHLARKSNPTCRVVAFEPEPARFEALKSFFDGADKIQIFPHAIMNKGGTVKIYKIKGRSASVDYSLSQWPAHEKHEKYVIEVPAVTLDGMFEQDVPDVIKMDIEGAELFALEGMHKLLATQEPVIFLEVHQRFIKSIDPQGLEHLRSLLRKYGYQAFNNFGEVVDLTAGRVILATPERARKIVFDPISETLSRLNSLDFSRKFSRWFNAIQQLYECGAKVILYGNGSVGKTIRALLPGLVVTTVDQSSNVEVLGPENNWQQNIYSPQMIMLFPYDFVLITVLGREEEIIEKLVNDYNVSLERIFFFDVEKEPSLIAVC